MRALHRALGEPSSAYASIHIAGSSGKGTVATMIAKALEASGLRVGLFTSPHLVSFCERIQINGIPITEEELAREISQIGNVSFFEMVTCAALSFFRRSGVDVAVLETGLGGRWDPTNVVTPILSIITSIQKEHCRILGGDLDAIAREKAGIFKPRIPAVIGPKARLPPIVARARALGIPLHVAATDSPLFEEENRAIARLSLHALPYALSQEHIAQGLAAQPPCRFERIGDALLDGAHHPDAIARLLQALSATYPHRKLRFVLGFSRDKDYEKCVAKLCAHAAHIYAVQARTPRALPASLLGAALKARGYHNYSIEESIATAVKRGYAAAQRENDLLVITGSFYILAEATSAILSVR